MIAALFCFQLAMGLASLVFYFTPRPYSEFELVALFLSFVPFLFTRRVKRDRIVLGLDRLDEREIAVVARADRISISVYFIAWLALLAADYAITPVFSKVFGAGSDEWRSYNAYGRRAFYAPTFFVLNAAIALASLAVRRAWASSPRSRGAKSSRAGT